MAEEGECGDGVGANLVRFYKLRGWQVVAAGAVSWVPCGTGARWLMSVPEYALPAADAGELSRLLRETGMLALRYPARRQSGIPAGLYVVRDKRYSLDNVRPSFRQAVRRGLRSCQIRPVEPAELLTQGLECNRDTMRRQGRKNPEFDDPARWERFVDAAWRVPGIEVTGAFVDGELSAYQIGCLDDGWWTMLYAFSRTHLRHHRPSHALMFKELERSIRRPGVSAVCSGPKTLLVDDGLHVYKTRFGFELEPHEVVIRLHPALEPFLTGPIVMRPLGLLRKVWPGLVRAERLGAFLACAREARRLSQGAASGTPRNQLQGT